MIKEKADTQEEFYNGFNKLINHNGGWCVMGSNKKLSIGDIAPFFDLQVVIISESTYEEARRDCEYLGYKFTSRFEYYYRVMMD